MSAKAVYEKDQRFGFLLLIEETEPYISPSGQTKRKFKFLCDCGNVTEQTMNDVKGRKIASCGCYRDTRNLIHGGTGTDTYKIWVGMKTRCYNKNYEAYNYYGARGIKVCDRWLESFENFLEDMGERPEGMSIDRLNVDGDYSPDNCRWADQGTQVYNRRKRNSKSGYTGITLKSGKYYVRIAKDKQIHYIGSFELLFDAVCARQQAEMKFYGQVKTTWEEQSNMTFEQLHKITE